MGEFHHYMMTVCLTDKTNHVLVCRKGIRRSNGILQRCNWLEAWDISEVSRIDPCAAAVIGPRTRQAPSPATCWKVFIDSEVSAALWCAPLFCFAGEARHFLICRQVGRELDDQPWRPQRCNRPESWDISDVKSLWTNCGPTCQVPSPVIHWKLSIDYVSPRPKGGGLITIAI